MSFLGFLFIAWILQFFHFDTVIIQGFKEMFGMDISIYSYYLLFFFIGVLYDLLALIFARGGQVKVIREKLVSNGRLKKKITEEHIIEKGIENEKPPETKQD